MTTAAGTGRIRGRYGPFRGLGVESSEAITIGRGSGNDLVLGAPEVSKQHAQLAPEANGTWRLTDLGSSNGTRVDGLAVNRHELRDGETIEIAGRHMRYEAR